ncbi:MAG TPA: hypothetical protein VFX65_08645 [Candidatus Limnocylindrales bacterium]|nr:hypothetical protein [Candidatus Limnocylindrales bacterium]
MTRTTNRPAPRTRTARIARIAGLLAALGVALTVAAAPVLAAPRPATQAGAGQLAQAEELTARHRCAAAWRAAAAEPTVANYQAVGFCEIDRRLATIDRLGSAIEDARALTDDHQRALEQILDDAATGLRELRAEIEADASLAELREDIRSIFEDFRIYVLVVRQVWLVVAADTVDAAGAALGETGADLAVLIERAEAAGQDVTEAVEHHAAMEAAVAAALAAVDGVADDVLPLTPADWNDGTAGPILRAARQAIADARADLRTAMTEARQVVAALAG